MVKPAPLKTEDCRSGIVQVTFLQVDHVKYFREIREWICSSQKYEEILNRRFLPSKAFRVYKPKMNLYKLVYSEFKVQIH